MEPSTDAQKSSTPKCCNNTWSTIRKNKYILTLLILVFDILLCVGSYFYIVNVYYKRIPPCLTPTCVLSAAEITKKIDTHLNPCDDFYSFACFNYEAKTFVPAYRSDYDPFIELQETVDEELRSILQLPIYSYDKPTVILAKNLYHSCMDAKLVEANSLPTLREIYQKLGGWPVTQTDNWNETAFDWQNTTHQFMFEGLDFHTFFKISLLPDNKHPNKYQIAIFQPDTEYLKKSLLMNAQGLAIEAYYKYMVEVAKIFGAPAERAYKEMQDVVNFIVKLVGLIQPMGQILNDPSALNQVTIGNLQETYPYVNWLEFINKFFNSTDKFSSNDSVIVVSHQYLMNLGNLLRTTPKRVLANYMFWQVTRDMSDYLNYGVRNAKAQFLNIHSGIVDQLPRAYMCLKKTLQLDLAVGLILSRSFDKDDIGSSITGIVDDVKNQLVLTIKSAGWMDVQTGQEALKKAHNLVATIAYTTEYLDEKFVENYYKELNIDVENFLKSILRLRIFQHKKSYQNYQNQIDQKRTTLKNRWSSVFSIRPFYNPSANAVEIPKTLLQRPFYSNVQQQYLNYANIGYIIGREIIYAFDTEGQQYDTNGNLVNWWQQMTRNMYVKKTQCVIDQYSNITDLNNKKLKFDGVRTLDENIADNVAIRLAYRAYRRWAQFHRDELKLPGLDFNPFQLFWIAFGQQFCTVQTDEKIESTIYESSHVLPKYRVNVPLMNSEEFARDFNCPQNSRMNPQRKCEVW